MIKLIFSFVFIISFSFLSFAQDNEQLIKYYELLGKSTNELITEWGRPLFKNTNEYGVQVYTYKKEAAEFQFYVYTDTVIAGLFYLNPGDAFGTVTFYYILIAKLKNAGFSNIGSSTNPKTEIYSNGVLKITMQLIKEYSDTFYIVSSAVFED